jgi:hypothetical protein
VENSELDNRIAGINFEAVKMLAEAVDRRIGEIVQGDGGKGPIDARLLSWYLRFRCINLAEMERYEYVKWATGLDEVPGQCTSRQAAEDVSTLFRMIANGEMSGLNFGEPKAFEMLLSARDEAVNFLMERPHYCGIDQSYGQLIPAPL